MLQALPSVKCLFTVDEEVGGIGAYAAFMGFFDNCSLVIQLDRNAYKGPELITYSGGIEMAGGPLLYAMKDLMEAYCFEDSVGMFTDVNCLKSSGLDICAFNVTAGYYDEHGDDEVLYVPAYENSLNFCYEVMSSFGYQQRWEHKAERGGRSWKGSGYVNPYVDSWGEYDDWYEKEATKGKADEDLEKFYTEVDCPKCKHSSVWYDIGMYYCPSCGEVWDEDELNDDDRVRNKPTY